MRSRGFQLVSVAGLAAVVVGAPSLVALAPSQREPWVQPCLPGGEPYRRAVALFRSLDVRIRGLNTSDDVDPLNDELGALLRSPCFAMSAEHPRDVKGRSASALRRFWEEGGAEWVGSYLEMGKTRAQVIVPPDLRPWLTEEDPLGVPGDVLCPALDLECGTDTREWARNAQEALLRGAAEGTDARSSDCWPRAKTRPAGQQYAEWRTCLESTRRQVPALPLGRFRSPSSGWLVIWGRRGHYDFCDEVRAFELATGSVHLAQSCSQLALGHDGAVDPGQTARLRLPRVIRGRVPPERVREVLWMLFLAPHAQPAQIVAERHEVPSGLRVGFRQGSLVWEGDVEGGLASSTAQTRLSWAWIRAEGVREGQLTWPRSSRPGEDYAVSLLRGAEESLVEGCPLTPLPGMAGGSPGGWPLELLERFGPIERELLARLTAPEERVCETAAPSAPNE